MVNFEENKLLKLIKFAPTFLLIFISCIMGLLIYLDAKITYEKEKESVRLKFLKDSKDNIQSEVTRVYSYIKYLQNNTEAYLKKSIKDRTYEAHSIATNIYETYKNKKSKKEILQLIKVALDKIRFNDGRGYFFIDDEFGNKLLLPLDKKNEGKNYLDYIDEDGYAFVKAISQTIKNKDERYDEYFWPNPTTGVSEKKIAFYKYFEPLNLAIGSGEYIGDFTKTVQQQALEYINIIKFQDSGYIFVIQNDGIFLSHINKDLLGKHYGVNIIIEDENGNTVGDIIGFAKNNGEGFFSYLQRVEEDSSILRKKTSYVKALNDWHWIIGAGFYEDEFISNIKELEKKSYEHYSSYIKNSVVIFIFLILGLLLISQYISKYLMKILEKYKLELKQNQYLLHQKTKMESMGEMIGNIAHQWRQPLSIITTSASAMKIQKHMKTLSDEIFFEFISTINNTAIHLSKTIDDFKDFFKLDKEKNRFFIKDAFNKAFSLISVQFNRQNINIIQNIDDIKIISYENYLIQVFMNILNNARDELINKEYDKYIFIDVHKIDDEIIISIKDNAGGIKIKNINKIFEAYFSTKLDSNGTGVGLYMTKNIIQKQLNGTIEVQNSSFEYESKSFFGANFIIKIKS